MGKERNRLRLERDKNVSEDALPELTKLREEQLEQKKSSKAAPPAKESPAPVAKKATPKPKKRTAKKAVKKEE